MHNVSHGDLSVQRDSTLATCGEQQPNGLRGHAHLQTLEHTHRHLPGWGPCSTTLLAASLSARGWWLVLAAVLLATIPPMAVLADWPLLFGLLLAPPGAWLRFALARRYNARWPNLPAGTLAANLIAVAIAAACTLVLSHADNWCLGAEGQEQLRGVVAAVQSGFCGCLSTLATMCVEMTVRLPRRAAVRYAAVTILASQLVALPFTAVATWAPGFRLCTKT